MALFFFGPLECETCMKREQQTTMKPLSQNNCYTVDNLFVITRAMFQIKLHSICFVVEMYQFRDLPMFLFGQFLVYNQQSRRILTLCLDFGDVCVSNEGHSAWRTLGGFL